MKIIVTGAGGLLGREVWRLFEKEHELIAISRNPPPQVPPEQWKECDLTRAELTYQVITRENPDLVVHTAAYNDVDGAEKNPSEAYQTNAIACRHLATACQRFDATLMSVSSDYVFDGETDSTEGYREFDPCRPISKYGESKRWGEMFVSDLLNKFFVIRTSWLFGPTRATWVDKVAAASREGASVNAVSDMTSSPTYTPDLAEAMLTLAESRHYGFYHLTNAGACTRVELAEEINRIHQRVGKAQIQSLTQDQLSLPARRPRNSTLQNLTWTLNGQKPLRSWQKALAHHFDRLSVKK